MRGLNRAMLIGHLGREPELRTSATSQVSWCTFTLATGRSRKEGDRWVEATDWHRVKVFGTQAELCNRYLTKGSMVAVEGSVVYDTWTGKDGAKRTTTLIMADRVTFLARGASKEARPEDPVAVAEAK